MAVYYYDDDEFGRMTVKTRVGLRRASFRWTGDRFSIMMPAEVADEATLRQLIDRNREGMRRLAGRSQSVSYHVGQRIECFKCAVTIARQEKSPDLILLSYDDDPELRLSIPAGVEIDDYEAHVNVSIALQAMMDHMALKRLIPHARRLAEQLGVHPRSITIGRGLRKLGHCTQRGDIQLSRSVMFLPEPLADYVIYHEFAHLTHFNHSAAFHALCNQYCQGREKELAKTLRAFRWPVLRQ